MRQWRADDVGQHRDRPKDQPAVPDHTLLALQRLVGNRSVHELLAVQRHALGVDELTDANIEEDLPAQRLALATPAEVPEEEHDRLTQKGNEITRKAEIAYEELAATKGGANRVARHVGKAFRGGLLLKPTPIVRVESRTLSGPRQVELEAAGEDSRWFWWRRPEGEDYQIEHRNWGGGFLNAPGQGAVTIGIRDVVADRGGAELKQALIHEAVHQIQFEEHVSQGQDATARYRKEFEAYWVSGYRSDIWGETRRAEAIRRHIVGRDAADTDTVYPEIRDWYHAPARTAEEKAGIDAFRVGGAVGLTWWQKDVHLRRLLRQLNADRFSDDDRFAEWDKLDFLDKRRAVADQVLLGRLRTVAGGPDTPLGRALPWPMF